MAQFFNWPRWAIAAPIAILRANTTTDSAEMIRTLELVAANLTFVVVDRLHAM